MLDKIKIILLFALFTAAFSKEIDVVMFVSSGCPSCKQAAIMFHEMSQTVFKGKMSITIKPLYRQLGDIALVAAENQNKLWELIKAYSNTNRRIDAANIIDLFEEAGIDLDQINIDMQDSTRIFSILDANYLDAKKYGMNFTPHILINGKVFKGKVNPESIMEYIDALLTKTK